MDTSSAKKERRQRIGERIRELRRAEVVERDQWLRVNQELHRLGKRPLTLTEFRIEVQNVHRKRLGFPPRPYLVSAPPVPKIAPEYWTEVQVNDFPSLQAAT